jgi:hypothetical protein
VTENASPSDDIVNKFNAIIDSFINSEPVTIEDFVPVVEDQTTLAEILEEVPIVEQTTFNKQAKDRFNDIIDQFINKDEISDSPAVEEIIVEEPAIIEPVVEVIQSRSFNELKDETVPIETVAEDASPSDYIVNKFNSIIDSFINSEPVTIEDIVPVVEDQTTLAEILEEAPIVEQASFTEQAKYKFNDIIDQFISKDEISDSPAVEEIIVEVLRTMK